MNPNLKNVMLAICIASIVSTSASACSTVHATVQVEQKDPVVAKVSTKIGQNVLVTSITREVVPVESAKAVVSTKDKKLKQNQELVDATMKMLDYAVAVASLSRSAEPVKKVAVISTPCDDLGDYTEFVVEKDCKKQQPTTTITIKQTR